MLTQLQSECKLYKMTEIVSSELLTNVASELRNTTMMKNETDK